jgi:Uma2 family endonuclease
LPFKLVLKEGLKAKFPCFATVVALFRIRSFAKDQFILADQVSVRFCTNRLMTPITAPGIVPRVRASENLRISEFAITGTSYEVEEYDVSKPVLIIEVLSPANRAEIWANGRSYTTIPSLREIVLLSSTAIRAELLRKGEDGNWPAASTVIEDGDLILDSIGFTVALAAIYRTTRFAVA